MNSSSKCAIRAALTPNEHAALAKLIRRCNMAIYASPMHEADTEIPRLLGAQFGLDHLDANWLAGEDGISEIRVFDNGTRQHYIPYTDKAIKWHTDGYYNPPERTIRGMVLHCVRNASQRRRKPTDGSRNGLSAVA